MKLKTEVKDGHIYSRGYAIDDRDPTPAGVAADLAHDSLYAHALVQAMELTLYANGIMRVERAADELMREWGAK